MYKGGCLCGAVRYEISGPIRNIVYCHCSRCRKAQGSAFAANGIVGVNDFNIISGESELTGYESTPGQTRYFCKYCCSPIISRTAGKTDQVRVRIGTIESDITERPQAHIFVTSKASWEDICGNIPVYDEYEPNR